MGRSGSSTGAVWLAQLPKNARIAKAKLRAALRQLTMGPTRCSGVQHSHDGGKRSHTKRAHFFALENGTMPYTSRSRKCSVLSIPRALHGSQSLLNECYVRLL